MKFTTWGGATLCISLLSACAAQAPSSQLSRLDKVQVCTGNSCTTQSSDTITFQGEPADPQAQRRLEALIALGQTSPQAAYDLALRFLRGDGVERDSYQAIEWMRQAAEQGLAQAQFALGRLYLVGLEEMGPSPAEAQSWLQLAADQGVKEALPLLQQAQAAKDDAQAQYQAREEARTSWGYWYMNAPYYWVWQGSRWYQP